VCSSDLPVVFLLCLTPLALLVVNGFRG